MKITDAFDAVRDGTFEEFKKFYKGNINIVHGDLGLNLLSMAVVNDKNKEEKLKIMKFLISEGININFVDGIFLRNALHNFYFNVLRSTPDYMLQVTELLVENGIDINAMDKFGAIPLKYAITVNKLPTNEISGVYKYLIKKGSRYDLKDGFDKSCQDYAQEYSWRNDFLSLIKEDENGYK